MTYFVVAGRPTYQLLGPVIAHGEGGLLSAGGPKLLSVLAVLLLHPNQAVPESRLHSLVWGARPLSRVKPRLRVCISELRAVLGHQVLVRSGDGYQMNVAPGELDLQVFADAVSSARTALGAGQPREAATQLRGALKLWTGPPLGGVTLELAAQERPGLEERRLAALEELFNAELAAGRHEHVIAELHQVCAEHPFRERFTAQQMTALHRAGRRAEALSLYATTHLRLLRELGTSPSHVLRDTRRRILNAGCDARERSTSAGRRLPTGRTVPEVRGNLPHRVGTLVGRDIDIKSVIAAIREAPLVTLTGVGGVGKSQLALEVARQDESRFSDGVWLCELAALSSDDSVDRTLAATLRIPQRHGQPAAQSLIDHLKRRQLLLIIDNCEHVLHKAAELIDRIVSHCPKVTLLATSREALAIDGERVWKVPPLSTQDATKLFVQRARAVCVDFRPDRQTTETIADICRRLDGLPLALELAAARIPVLTAAEIAARLDDQRILARESSTAQPKHQSLAAAIDWSFQLLSKSEQHLFSRLSVFAGGADLAAIHSVCAEPEQTEYDTLDLLAALVAKSMVVANHDAADTRYHLLQTLRSYGWTKSQPYASLTRRHAEYFTTLAEQAAQGVLGPDEGRWIERTLPETENLRIAFDWAVANQNVDIVMRLGTSLPEVSQIRLGWEALGWAQRALEMASEEHPLFVTVIGVAARDAWNLGDFARVRLLAKRAGERAPVPRASRLAYPSDVVADIQLYEGQIEKTLGHYQKQVETARQENNPKRLLGVLYMVAITHAIRRTPELGLTAAQECLELAKQSRNPTSLSMAHYALGLVLKKSDPDRALPLLDEAAALAASVRNFWWQGISLMEAGATRAVHGDPTSAAQTLLHGLDHWNSVGDHTQLWLALRYVIRLLVRLGADRDAAVLHHCLVASGKSSPLGESRASQLAANLGSAEFAIAAKQGAELSSADAVGFARSCLGRLVDRSC